MIDSSYIQKFTKSIKKAIHHFIDFHQGAVNVLSHIIGFTGIFYAIYNQNITVFIVALLILEFGHLYNHFTGIKKYDFRLKVTLWRIAIFILVLLTFHYFTFFI